MKVCVLGLGYIGFPAACVMARAGHEVIGVDIDCGIVNKLSSGGLHIVNEDGLADAAREAFDSGRLRVGKRPEPADVFVVAVPTPFRMLGSSPASGCQNVPCPNGRFVDEAAAALQGDYRPFPAPPVSQRGADLSYVEAAVRDVASVLTEGSLVVLESTVPPGTTLDLVLPILESGANLACGSGFFLVHAPERVLPGNILRELVGNDRIIGGADAESTTRGIAFYRTFTHGDVVATDATTAELVKLMENTFRDVNIALANEFALVAESLDINVFDAICLANRHPRVNILKPGPGVGGHCIAVDPYFIVEAVPERARLIALARYINSTMPRHVFELFLSAASRCLERGMPVRKVAVLGASYKANTGDKRESSALEFVEMVRSAGYGVQVHDPYIEEFSAVPLERVLSGADLLALLTDHSVYQSLLAPGHVLRLMRQPVILDTRGFMGRQWDDAGFDVVRLGVGGREGGSRRWGSPARASNPKCG